MGDVVESLSAFVSPGRARVVPDTLVSLLDPPPPP